tara:strand:- start:916 stop:1038 length:123 start_codon:yes stop_codon:yes gene_type:complete
MASVPQIYQVEERGKENRERKKVREKKNLFFYLEKYLPFF